MKSDGVFFPEVAIVDFLKENGRGSNSKDYEFIVAIVVKRFCEKQWSVAAQISFPLKQKYSIALRGQSNINVAQLKNLLRRGIDENSPIDFTIGRGMGVKPQGLSFQVKRFGIGRERKDSNELVEYLNSLTDVYAKVKNISLVIILDMGTNIDKEVLRDALNIENFPFDRLMFIWMSNNKVNIAEFYPQDGMESYELSEFA